MRYVIEFQAGAWQIATTAYEVECCCEVRPDSHRAFRRRRCRC